MPSTIDLRRRIRSVKSTQQLTKAMKMLAAAKLRRAQEAGVVRPDVTIDEVVRMVGGIAKIPADDPADIQRLLAVALDGLRYRAR